MLFNNAGIGTGGPIAQMSFEDMDRVVAINLGGVLNGAKIGHAYLATTPGSCLLNTASASAIYGTSGLVVYSATKFGVRALTEGLDGEWYGDGIKVRDLIPGFIDTPLLQGPIEGSNRNIREAVTECRARTDQPRRGRRGGMARGAWRRRPHLCRQDRVPAQVRGEMAAGEDAQADAARDRRAMKPLADCEV